MEHKRQLGTRHPIRVIKVGSDGRWVVACQARRDSDRDGRIHVDMGTDSLTGDELVPYLFRGAVGNGEPLDALLDHSSDGRWIVVVRDGRLTVVDNLSGVEQSIPDADVSPGQGGYGNVAKLDYEQKRLLYFRGIDRHTLVIRGLVDQRELIAQASLPLTGVEPERNSPWVALWFAMPASRDRVVHHVQYSTGGARAYTCQVSGAEAATPQEARPHDAWVNVETGEIKKTPTVVAHLNGQEVTESADGGVRVGTDMFVPAACGGDVRVASAQPPRLIVSCRNAKPEAPLEMFGPSMHATLVGTDAREGKSFGRIIDPILTDDSPYVCLQNKACFAFEDGRRIAVPGRPSEVRGSYILSADENEQLVTDARSGVTTLLLPVARMRSRNDRVERIGSLVVDFSLSPPRAVRELGPQDEAIDDHGRVLSEALPPADGSLLSWGPLRWVDPEL